MEPTLSDGSYILVDRRQPQLRHGRIYVVRTPEGLVVKRLEQDSGGGWWLLSDHPAWKPVAWTDRAELIGEVKWAGRPL
jgi:phage repressor protein C with HTH and peptisase S24 domain